MNQFVEFVEMIKGQFSGKDRKIVPEVETTLLGNAKHKGKDAWFHEIFRPLSTDQISTLESTLNCKFHPDLKTLFASSNGLRLFSDELAIFGARSNFQRSGNHIWQPYCIVTANTNDRPSFLPQSSISIGSYSYDGSIIAFELTSGSITVHSPEKPFRALARWSSISEFLTSEYSRLGSFFNGKYELIDEECSTLPKANNGDIPV